MNDTKIIEPVKKFRLVLIVLSALFMAHKNPSGAFAEETSGPWGGPIKPPQFSRASQSGLLSSAEILALFENVGPIKSAQMTGDQPRVLYFHHNGTMESLTPAQAEATLALATDLPKIAEPQTNLTSKSKSLVPNKEHNSSESNTVTVGALKGKWRILSNKFCSKWVSEKEVCYSIRRNGTEFEIIDSAGKIVERWSK